MAQPQYCIPGTYTATSEVMESFNNFLIASTTKSGRRSPSPRQSILPAEFSRDLEGKLVAGSEASTFIIPNTTATTDTISAKLELTLSVDLIYVRSKQESGDMRAIGDSADLKRLLLGIAKDMIIRKANEWGESQKDIDGEGWEIVEVIEGEEAWVIVEVQGTRNFRGRGQVVDGPVGELIVTDHQWIRI